MKNPVHIWTLEYVEFLRRKSACIGVPISYTFISADREKAITKLGELYPGGRVNPSFADRILYLSEIY